MTATIEKLNLEADVQQEEIKSIENERKSILKRIKEHKKQLILAGISIVAIIGIIISIKKKDDLIELWLLLEKKMKKTSFRETKAVLGAQVSIDMEETLLPTREYTLPKEVVDVSRHIRNMKEGRHHSKEKAVEAAALGIQLLPNQTLVKAHKKYEMCVA